MEIRQFPAAGIEARTIIARLDESLLERYEPGDIHGIDGNAFDRAGGYFVICTVDGRPVGCGAFRPIDTSIAEVKRMFVEREHRGRGLATAILQHLEREMGRRGFETSVLETGGRQVEAIRLYRKLGYTPIPRFGGYADCEVSLCFAKRLGLRSPPG